MLKCHIHLVAGTRPNVMKIAPLYKVLTKQAWCTAKIVFLEQHTDANMGAGIFSQLGVNEGVMRVSIANGDVGDRLGSIISKYTDILRNDRPHLVVVPGDVDASLGAALAAKREHCTVAHLEAGLRSHDMRMPEELNRILIDSVSDILLSPSEASAENLIHREAKPSDKVHFVGNIMIDSLLHVLNEDRALTLMDKYGVKKNEYCVVTFHRPSNVDDSDNLDKIIFNLTNKLAPYKKIIFPVHPRTRKAMSPLQLTQLESCDRIILTDPLPYGDFINLVSQSSLVVTDSGGIQEETTYLRVPCFTMRETTERPITTISGTNTLVSIDDIELHIEALSNRKWPSTPIPLWDGFTAYRCGHVFNTWWRNIMDVSTIRSQPVHAA